MQARDEAESQRHLERLVKEHAEPVIRRIIGRRWHLSLRPGRGASLEEQEAEDVYSEVLLQLLARLRDLKAHPDGEAIHDFGAYVAVTTFHACDRHLRQKYPRRWSLKNRLRYLLTHHHELALWESDRGEWLCGLAAWRGPEKRLPETGRPQPWRDRPQALAPAAPPGESSTHVNLADLLAAVFHQVGQPIELDELVTVIAGLWGVSDRVVESDTRDQTRVEARERVPDPRADVAAQVDQRAYLQRLWEEIRQLPPRQCAALLLNLRDARGRGIIALFPLMGIATIREIAAALALPAEQFAALWNDLPLDDATIARHLGITRQQVINLRKVARERLARRMKACGF